MLMEDLKTAFDKGLTIIDINQQVHRFVHSLDDYENRLKKVFVLLNLVAEADTIIRSVDTDAFISDICERIIKLNQEAVKLDAEYHAQLVQNDMVLQILTDSSVNRVEEIKKEIATLLNEYDDIIKTLVDIREKMTIEEQIAEENKNGTNA